LVFFCFDDDGFARSAHAGVDDGEKNGAGGIVRRNSRDKARAFFDLKRRDLMRDVHDAHVGGDVDDYGFTDGDGVVRSAEIGDEDDRGVRCDAASVRFAGEFFARCDAERDCRKSGNEKKATARHGQNSLAEKKLSFPEPSQYTGGRGKGEGARDA